MGAEDVKFIHFCHKKSYLARSKSRSTGQKRGQANVIARAEYHACQMQILCLGFQGLFPPESKTKYKTQLWETVGKLHSW